MFVLIRKLILIVVNFGGTAATQNVANKDGQKHDARGILGTEATLRHQQNVIKLQQVPYQKYQIKYHMIYSNLRSHLNVS